MKQINKQNKKSQKLGLGLAAIFASGVLCTNAMAGVIAQPSPSGFHMGVGDGGFIPSSQTLGYLESAHNPMPGAGPSNDPHQNEVDREIYLAASAGLVQELRAHNAPNELVSEVLLASTTAASVQPSPDANPSANHHVKLVSVNIFDPHRLDHLKPMHNPMPDTSASGGTDGYRTFMDPLDSWFEIDPAYNLSSDEVASWQALETWSPRLAQADFTAKILRHNARMESAQSLEVDQLQKISVLLTAICASEAHCKIADAGL